MNAANSIRTPRSQAHVSADRQAANGSVLVHLGRGGFLLAVGAIAVAVLARLLDGGNTVALLGALPVAAALTGLAVAAAGTFVSALTIQPLDVSLEAMRGVV